jgi:hypothetical protein
MTFDSVMCDCCCYTSCGPRRAGGEIPPSSISRGRCLVHTALLMPPGLPVRRQPFFIRVVSARSDAELLVAGERALMAVAAAIIELSGHRLGISRISPVRRVCAHIHARGAARTASACPFCQWPGNAIPGRVIGHLMRARPTPLARWGAGTVRVMCRGLTPTVAPLTVSRYVQLLHSQWRPRFTPPNRRRQPWSAPS